ncbi:MAG: sugar ABC transporter permease [Dactylosporangium sp.]|nr:sugar ABC transporter permease [Dactylosporangium sp.]
MSTGRQAAAPPGPAAGPPPTKQPPPRRQRDNRWGRYRQWGPGLLLISPSLLLLGVFVYGFLGWNVRVSFTSWRGLTPKYDFVWLQNYTALWNDERWMIDVRNIAIFTLVFVIGSMGLGFIMAVLLEPGVRGENIMRSVFLLPMAISFIATAIVWRWLLDNGTGENTTGLNQLFANLGLEFLRSDWHKSTSGWAVAAMALPAGWTLAGYVMTMFLAGMRGVPDSLREAARLDGASERQVFWYVTRPTIRPVGLSIVLILVHVSLKTFDLMYAIDQRNVKIDTPSLYMWFTTFDGGFYNRGATIATLLLFGVVLVIGPYIWFAVRSERT